MKPYADKLWEVKTDRVPVEAWAGDLEEVAKKVKEKNP